jgi:hypothetical protein
VNFFGYYNGFAPLFELGHWTNSPIHATCAWCHELIQRGENGVDHGNGNCEHIECFITSIVGSIAHQERRCTCYDGFTDCKNDEMSRRDIAKVAFKNWQQWGTPSVSITEI